MIDHDESTIGEPALVGDADLVLRSRSGDVVAFGELWRRHYRSGISVARSVSPSTDPDDLVQEAYTKIYQSILRGGGPTGSFRAYLFTSIRNTAAGWGRTRRETAIDELETLEDPATTDEATAASLDRGLTHQAFRSLPTRWQEVLWYSEIEGMKPAEIAPLLGMKPTAVAQLTFRAREGLREAWIQAHLRSVADGSDCAWSIERLGAYSRNNVGRRDRARLEQHLASCARCAIVASEAKEVSSRLALVLIPLTVGVAGTAGYLATLQGGAPIVAVAAMPSSVMQGAVTAGAGAAGSATAGAGAGAVGSSAAGSMVVGSSGLAGAGSAVGAGAGSAVGAGSAATAGVAAAGGAGAATAAATVTAAAGGLLSTAGVAGIAAAGLIVAGTVAAAVALPGASDPAPAEAEPASAVQTVDEDTLTPLEMIAAATVPVAAPGGPTPSDIPLVLAEVIPSTADPQGGSIPAAEEGGIDATADTSAPDDTAGVTSGGTNNGTNGNGGTNNGGVNNGGTNNGGVNNGGTNNGGTNSGGVNNGTTGNGGVNNGGTNNGTDGNGGTNNGGTNNGGVNNGGTTGNGGVNYGGTNNGTHGNGGTNNGGTNNGGVNNGGTNNGTPQNGSVGNGGTNGNAGGVEKTAGVPDGSPSIVSSSASTADGSTAIDVTVGGAEGATVQARIRGTVRATALLEDGTAVLTIAPTAAELAADARLELRYVNGSRVGTPVSTRLSDLF